VLKSAFFHFINSWKTRVTLFKDSSNAAFLLQDIHAPVNKVTRKLQPPQAEFREALKTQVTTMYQEVNETVHNAFFQVISRRTQKTKKSFAKFFNSISCLKWNKK